MNARRKRVWLTAVAIAGSVALYGCGGGDSGPDKTPFDQKAVDKAAADAKKKAEMEAAAAATAIAEAATASAEAKKAMDAAEAAKKAAAAAAKYAMTATLDMAKAMAASGTATAESDKASAAAKAARAAAANAGTAAAGHQSAKDADDSAKSAEKNAMEAAASAAAALRSYQTARSLDADRKDTADLAAAAGVHAQTAMRHAETAEDEAGKAKAQVKIAKEATARKAAEDARMAAKTASEAAAKAADDAATAADAIRSDAAAVAAEKAAARTHADAAKTSAGNAVRYSKRAAGYADARKARDEADDGKKDLERHADLRMRVPWIDAATTKDAMTVLENAAKAARSAAESLERATDPDVIAARQNNIASERTKAEAARTEAANDLAAAREVYNKAKPFSEDGMGIDADNLASGKTLRHPDGWISVNRNDGRLWAADQEFSEKGPYDVIHAKYGVTSFGKLFEGAPITRSGNTTKNFARYQVNHNNKWVSGPGSAVAGQINTYKYVSFGIWGRSKNGFALFANNLQAINYNELTEAHSFVFAEISKLAKDMPITGSAEYLGNHENYTTIFSGNKGSGGLTPVILDQMSVNQGNLTAGELVDYMHFGTIRATIDFSNSKVDLRLNNVTDTYMVYDITGIDLDRSKGTFSGGKYLGRRGGTPSATLRTNRTPEIGREHDPFKPLPTTTEALVPTIKLHGGVFGPSSDEIAGTIHLTVTVPHKETTHVATAKDGRITVRTSFAAANQTVP